METRVSLIRKMSDQSRRFYEFGPFRLDDSQRLLQRNGEEVPLPPKLFDTLLLLVSNSGYVLEKEKLIDLLWPECFVKETSLTQNISLLRKMIGELTGGRQYIETIPKRGYRFVAEVKEINERMPAIPILRRANGDNEPGDQVPSLAVLPFKNLGAKTIDSLGAGIADTLINRLTGNLKQISVRPTTAVLKYRDSSQDPMVAAQELSVDSLLDGTYQLSGDRLRVSTQLIRVKDGATMWASTCDEHLTDIFTLQDSIAAHVTPELTLRLVPPKQNGFRSGKADHEAFEFCTKGRYFWNTRTQEGLERAVDYAQRALSINPKYGLAHCIMADSYSLLGEYLYMAPGEAFPIAKTSALEAIKIDGHSAEANAVLGEVSLFHEWNWSNAEKEYLRAIELDPAYTPARHWYAWYLLMMRRFDEASAVMKEAEALDPTSLHLHTILGLPFYYKREYEKAIEFFRRALELDCGFPQGHFYLGSALLYGGEYQDAIKHLEKVGPAEYTQQVWALLAYAFGRAGDTHVALRIASELQELSEHSYVSPYTFALIHAGLHEKEKALCWLEKAYSERAAWMVFLNIDPAFDDLRSEPRFQKIIELMNFPKVD